MNFIPEEDKYKIICKCFFYGVDLFVIKTVIIWKCFI